MNMISSTRIIPSPCSRGSARLRLAAVIALTAWGASADAQAPLDGGVFFLDAGLTMQTAAEGGAEPEAAPATPPPVTTLPEPALDAVDVTVRSGRSNRTRVTRSSEAVTIVSLTQARKRSADLGEVLSRVSGVSVRRYGGLGSDFRISINGLYDTAVRVFVDGVPIDRVYAVDIVNVPVNLLEDVEIYRGVVPLRFGADALGGAINLVRPKRYETSVQASYQAGSFGMHRATLNGRYRHEPSGVVGGIDLFYDRAKNNYLIDVLLADKTGQLTPARIPKFHDGYEAYGASAEVGIVDKRWARKLMLRGFYSTFDKERPHNIVMTVPYGEVRYGAAASGAILSYENTFAEQFDLDVTASYSYRSSDLVDKSQWFYDWRGNRVRARPNPGEIENRARDRSTWQHGTFARLTLDWRLAPGHVLTASLSPTFSTRTGDERIQSAPDARDPLTAERKLLKSVAALGYTFGLGELARAPRESSKRRVEHHRFENVVFAKTYVYRTDAEEPLPGNVFVKRGSDKNRVGAGDSLRFTLIDEWLVLKTSYEYAVRLPEADEVFGNGFFVLTNLALAPELSHNANFETIVDKRRTRFGDFWLDVNFFVRRSENMVVLLGNDRYYAYQNVFGARSLGVENTLKWTSPGRYATLDGQFTYTDQRNTSNRGAFADFDGDRIPNRPWLTASWGGYLHFEGMLSRNDTIEPFYQGRYVGDFFRGWEGAGVREYKQVVPSQVSHDLGVTYAFSREEGGRVFATFDVQNLSDARLYDSFGVLRPSRGYYLKLAGEL